MLMILAKNSQLIIYVNNVLSSCVSVRLSGVLILLGVSTYWCYRCLKSFNSGRFIRIRSCSQSSNCNILSPEDLDTSSSSPPSPRETDYQHIANWSPLHLVDNYLHLQVAIKQIIYL